MDDVWAVNVDQAANDSSGADKAHTPAGSSFNVTCCVTVFFVISILRKRHTFIYNIGSKQYGN